MPARQRPPARPLARPRRLAGALLIRALLAGVLLAGCTTGHATTAPGGSTPAAAPGFAASSSTAAQPASSAATPSQPTTLKPDAASPSAARTEPAQPPTQAATPRAAPTPPATVPGPVGFVATSAPVTAAELGKSWHSDCPVGPPQLRTLTLTYWGFDDAPHVGVLVVNASVVAVVSKVFRTLFAEKFPIRSMLPTAAFGGSDDASMAADNSSAFNCRYAVATGTPRWSAHSYGKAIDINTIENPYLLEGKVLPPQGAPYLKRTPYRPGMAVAGGQLVKAFAASGWQWGGRWTGSPDYQHFSADGG